MSNRREVAQSRFAWRWCLWVVSATVVLWAGYARAQLQGADERAQAVAQTVLGIISYTRWPAEPSQVRLCVVGPTEYADELIKAGPVTGARKTIVRRMYLEDPRLLSECEGVYVGVVSDGVWRRLLARLEGHPLLSISEQPQLCSIGSMFCLDVRTSGVYFDINIDSVARSGVRVNPRVLQLSKRRGGE